MTPGVEVHPERNARIVQLRLEDASHELIAEVVGSTRSAVSHVLSRAGVVECKADAEMKARAVALAAKHGAAEAARQVRFSVFSVRRWVRKARQEAQRG